MATEAEKAAVLEVLADRGYATLTSEVGWSLHPEAPNRWAASCRRRAARILKAMAAEGLVVRTERKLSGKNAELWSLPDEGGESDGC